LAGEKLEKNLKGESKDNFEIFSPNIKGVPTYIYKNDVLI
jgi:hypothetical protein